jgi:glycosyltransferase involved in cell wall biosynthesis
MIVSTYPKILIFGAPFNNFYGGGITLSNLFKGWPKDKIAVAATGHVLQGVSFDVCDLYYRLGSDEQRWRFPLNLVQRSFPSGRVSPVKQINPKPRRKRIRIRRILVNNIFYPVVHWFGLFHSLSAIHISDNFLDWLSDFKPELLYLQVSSREDILFATKLYDHLGIPAVIHMMDDWPSTISKSGLFKNYWEKIIDSEFKQLLDRMDLFLSISDYMSAEYKNRYNKVFIPFHNPIDISRYKQIKVRETTDTKIFKMLYLGRLGLANKHAIFSFANAMSHIVDGNDKIELEIITPGFDSTDAKKIDSYENVRVLPPVKHDMVPEVLTKYDFLLLPLDFTDHGFKFAQYSIPTKASEYMISGTPIIIFAPKETAISKFCSENECAYCITENDERKIIEALQYLLNNYEYRKKISSNAVRLATERFDSERVRNEFQQLLIKTTRQNVYE